MWWAGIYGPECRGSNPTSASGLPLSRLGQPGNIQALVLPLGVTERVLQVPSALDSEEVYGVQKDQSSL
ncbi:hypothetical protein CSKR_106463 [Clonorchis sinensis]|uniref:Uncharacterized protein n=1 Tax=Clonorchis sinensis TaxID=79923 RepID=A0A3R7GAK7_CLOSI|nr:hypothetical protein CSKR_106463 [Clonorchis sinensis]